MLLPFITTEVRWFYPGEIAGEVYSWFSTLGDVQQQPPRTDLYRPGMGPKIGIKVREGRLEIKPCRKVIGSQYLAPEVSGSVESWVKWGIGFPWKFDSWIPVQKERQIIYYQVTDQGEVLPSLPGVFPPQGGGVELAQVRVGEGKPWWTLGIEVFGPRRSQEDNLKRIMDAAFETIPFKLLIGDSYSYPQLLENLKSGGILVLPDE